jgi:SEC-C motif-containing protein
MGITIARREGHGVSEPAGRVPPMQLVEIGRNEPCPCGSGRKYKKCCLAARDAAIAADPVLVAAVDQAIENDDWAPLYGRMDAAMAVFERGRPLGHVRFPHDQIRSRDPDRAEMAKMCTAGWIGHCEGEIAHVLDRFRLGAEQRDGLRLAAHLLRRFGALSPTVEVLARLQVAEHVQRVRRFAEAISVRGLTLEQVMAGTVDLPDWIERARPTVLSFAEWFALRTATDEQLDGLWLLGAAMRVCDACLDRLDGPSVDDDRSWLALAATTLFVYRSSLGRVLAHMTSPRQVSETERTAYAGIQALQSNEELRGILHRVLRETEERGDYAAEALLRAAIQDLQSSYGSR